MDDAQLVAAALAGDRSANATIYDRYADRIHDFCASILRNRADASDALQETFLVAFEALDQLAEPARLRPWLYAIAHRAILDRVGDRAGAVGGDDAGELVWGSGASDERLSRAELAEFVWQVSSGLSVRHRALLDLHLRQGLEGRDLASAAGVPGGQLEGRVERLESQVERSLGALLVARTERRSCPELAALLGPWNGRLTPAFRNEVTAHVDDCEVCNSRRRIAPSPLTLLGATPLAPAPAYLRGVVLGKAELDALERLDDVAPGRAMANAGWAFSRDGFPDLSGDEPRRSAQPARPAFASTRPTSVLPVIGAGGAAGVGGAGGGAGAVWAGAGGQVTAPTTYLPVGDPPARPPDDRDWRGMLVGGLAGLIILIAAVVIVMSSRTHSPSGRVGVGVTTSVAATVTTAISDTTAPATTASTAPATSLPSTTVAANGHLIVGGAKTLDLGVTSSSATVTLGNDGQAPLDFSAAASGTGLTVNPLAGTLGSGASQTLTVALDRSAAPPGPFTGSILITSRGGNATVMVNGVVDAGPTITAEMKPKMISATKCPGHPTSTVLSTSLITATVTSTLPLTVVVLHWQPSGAAIGGTIPMNGTGSAYTATLGPFAFSASSTVDWWVTAIDSAKATGTSSHQTLAVNC